MEIRFVGLRPGEKLQEDLFNSYEIVGKTPHPKILKALSNGVNGGSGKLLENMAEFTTEEVARVLPQLFPRPQPLSFPPGNEALFPSAPFPNRAPTPPP